MTRDPADETVWYSLNARSRPGRFFARLAGPLTRRVQARFAKDSLDEMARFVSQGGPSRAGPGSKVGACLIVGGTGGIGRACAKRFLDEGARVAVVGLTSREASPGGEPMQAVECIEGDVSRPIEVGPIFTEALRMLGGRIDVLVHAAGISGRRFGDGPLHECSDEGWEAVMAANARGAFLTNREAVRLMLAQDADATGLRGSIVNVGSVLAESPAPEFFGTVAYAASKGAMRSLTLASASRYAPDRVRFNLIEPGLIDTPMAGRAVGDPPSGRTSPASSRWPVVPGPRPTWPRPRSI